MRKTSPLFIGIDVAKTKHDVHFHPTGEAFTVANDDDGLGALIVILLLRSPKRVVFESTGGYARCLHRALQAVELDSHCVPSQRVRMFAKALGVEAKTDAIDASVIALYGATARLVDTVKPSEAVLKLRDLAVRRRQLVDLATRELNHRESLPPELAAGSKELLKVIRKNVATINKAMLSIIDGDVELAKRAAALRTIGGVGPVLCASLLAFLPELGTASNKQASSLVGVAPFNQDSSGSEKKRSIRGGRRRLRNVLYMATRAAVRSEPALKALYRRLKEAGKPDKVALTAAMRKLVVIANARVRDALRPRMEAPAAYAA